MLARQVLLQSAPTHPHQSSWSVVITGALPLQQQNRTLGNGLKDDCFAGKPAAAPYTDWHNSPPPLAVQHLAVSCVDWETRDRNAGVPHAPATTAQRTLPFSSCSTACSVLWDDPFDKDRIDASCSTSRWLQPMAAPPAMRPEEEDLELQAGHVHDSCSPGSTHQAIQTTGRPNTSSDPHVTAQQPDPLGTTSSEAQPEVASEAESAQATAGQASYAPYHPVISFGGYTSRDAYNGCK